MSTNETDNLNPIPTEDPSLGEDNPLRADEDKHKPMQFENDPERKSYSAQLIEEEKMRSVRSILITSILGLILSLLFGTGIILSVVALVRAAFCKQKYRSETLDWARNLAIIGIILSGLFIVSLVVYFNFNCPTLPGDYV